MIANNRFMNRYNNDDEYKQKHKDYTNEKIVCRNCAKLTSRCNMAKHMRTSKCKKECDKKLSDIKAILINEDDDDDTKAQKINDYYTV